MKKLRNFVFGAALAGICLAPAAWADGSLLVKGQVPDRSSLRAATVLPIGHALSDTSGAFPQLRDCVVRVIERIVQTSAGPVGTRNGA